MLKICYILLTFFTVCRSLHEELDIREKMFQEFREVKEREIAELKKINQDLEKRVHALQVQENQQQVLSFLPAVKGMVVNLYITVKAYMYSAPELNADCVSDLFWINFTPEYCLVSQEITKLSCGPCVVLCYLSSP